MSSILVDRLKFRDDTLMGAVVQVARYSTGEVATTTTALPADNTIPQNTEGAEFMSLAFTPKVSTNKLKITIVFHCTHSANTNTTVALFQDSTANALACSSVSGSNLTFNICFVHYMTAGTVASTTFKVRAGGNTGATLTFNGSGGVRTFGGVQSSSITIEEIQAD